MKEIDKEKRDSEEKIISEIQRQDVQIWLGAK